VTVAAGEERAKAFAGEHPEAAGLNSDRSLQFIRAYEAAVLETIRKERQRQPAMQ
jgi:hypothetical protein